MKYQPGTWTLSIAYAVGIIAISFSAIFVKWSDAPVSVIGMYRLLLTAAIMLPFAGKYMPQIRLITKKEWLMLFASGAALGMHFLFWMGSLRYTSVASSTVLLSIEPVLVMLGAYIVYKHKSTLKAAIGMALAVFGAMMTSWGDMGLSLQALQGDLLSLLGAAAVAVHMIIGQKLRQSISSFVYSISVFIAAAAVFAVYNAVCGISFYPYSAREWGIFMLLAIVPTVFGHVLFNWLLQYVKAASVSMSVLGEPIGAALLAYWLLGETVQPFQIVSGIVLIAGVWLFIRSGSHRVEIPDPAAQSLSPSVK
ncbi:DMT family transporter [Paenibacillus thalictri]|uniref:DMT family transporter n=1 Tax=Paenibacillus thalictri TaxID=2527873 RepID=UPI001F102D76|nr:DMT family transporter [Paenibacillus thalictri]